MIDYWTKQQPAKAAFPDIAWQRPEQKNLAGKLLIIGGNKLGFAAVAQAYTDAMNVGVGQCQVILPNALKHIISKQAFDCTYAPTNPSGGFSKDAKPILQAGIAWADAVLLIGDTGRNSETAIVLEELSLQSNKPHIITRDAIDLLRSTTPQLLQNPATIYVATLAQLQKIFQSVYYPKTILFSMQLTTLVETLHKFTITYPVTMVVFHQNQLIVAKSGQVSSTPWENPLVIWRGSVATKAAVYTLQHPTKIFEAITTSLIKNTPDT